MLLNALHDRKFIFFGGKGGVGKTTMAAAFSVEAARAGRKTLLVSTDPAHNLGDIFGTRLNGSPREVERNLLLAEIDPDDEAAAYVGGVKRDLDGLVRPEMRPAVEDYLAAASSAPGAAEAALFERIVSIVLEDAESFRYVVFDTAPTGHTLRLLQLPRLLGAWVEALVIRRENQQKEHAAWLEDGVSATDQIIGKLRTRRARFERVGSVFRDGSRTAFVFVLNPERLAVLETARAVEKLGDAGFPVGPVIINKVLPEGEEGPFLAARRDEQHAHLAEIRKRFGGYELLHVLLMARDVHGRDALIELSNQIQSTESWP